MNKLELKKKIKEVMIAHLETKGYPNLSAEGVKLELRAMYIKIEEAGLLQKGMTWLGFCRQFEEQALLSELLNQWNPGKC